LICLNNRNIDRFGFILKFLTTHQEVQAQYPFSQRPIDNMVSHLPLYLKNIINNYQQGQRTGAIHRFWIEAETVDVDFTEKESSNDSILQIKLDDIKMTVKKHRMERDINGELIDVGNEDEGWPIYVLEDDEFEAFLRKRRLIEGHAMIFPYARLQMYFFEDNNLICQQQVPDKLKGILIRLFGLPLNREKRIEPTTDNMPLLFRITNEMCNLANQPHRYSREFIFAHKFTTHYDEFAQYIPEFGRLRELCKMTVLVRLLRGIRETNLDAIKALNFLLGVNKHIDNEVQQTEVYQQYAKSFNAVKNNIATMFNDLRRQCASSVLKSKWQRELRRIKNDMGSLSFGTHSPEVNNICREFYNDVARQNPGVPSHRIWSEVVDPQRSDIAKKLSDSKYQSCRQQMYDIFKDMLYATLGAYRYGQCIDNFMRGNIDALVAALVNAEQDKVVSDLRSQFSQIPSAELKIAIDDHGSAKAHTIADRVAKAQLTEVKRTKDKIEQGFVNVHLNTNAAEPDTQGECFWVPASVRHEVDQDSPSHSRYSFFVYGGVNVQPRVNMTHGGGGSLGGNSVGGGSFNRQNITRGFQDHHIVSHSNRFTKNHQLFQLAGINVHSRVNKIYLPTNASLHPTRSIHIGCHTASYSQKVSFKMDDLVAQGKSAGWSQQQYNAQARNLLSDLRQELRQGNIGLNKHHRPWGTKW